MPDSDPNSPPSRPASPPISRLFARALTRGRPARSARPAGLLLLGLFLLLTAASVWTLQPPDPEPASAPAREFSARRALVDAEAIGRQPRPVGSPASAAARAHLTSRLTALGAQVEARPQPVARDEQDGTALVAEVTNIHASFPGTAGPDAGHLVLMAHYDSVPAGPGAADNAANVAAVLEVVRALRADGRAARNTVDVLFTDGEEPGLLGAHAFLADGGLDPANTVILNLEARGVSGPSIMFESGPRNSGALSALSGADRPIATSLADEVYTFLPNDTDFSEFKKKGFGGLNFAFVDGSARYHTPGDSLENLSAASVQHQGDNVLAAARALAGKDLTEVHEGTDSTYFTVLGLLVRYPNALVLPLALLAAAGYAGVLVYSGRRGLARRGVVRAALTFPLALAGAAAVAFGGWELLCLVRPGYADLSMGDSYRPGWFRAAFLTLTAAVAVGWYLLTRRRTGAAEAALGVWGWLTALGLATAVLAPGASYLFVWPPLVGCAALFLAVRRRTGEDGEYGRTLAVSLPALVALPLLLPVIVLVFPTLGLSLAVAPLILMALLVTVSLPLLGLLPRRTAPVAGWLALAAGVALVLTGLRVDTFDAEHPRHTSLAYAWDADRGTGHWLSSDNAPPRWTGALAGSERADVRARFPTFPTTLAGDLVTEAHIAKAAAASGPAGPGVSVTSEQAGPDGVRTVRLHIEPAADTSYISLFADTSAHEVRGAEVAGTTVRGGTNRPLSAGPWKWGFALWKVPAEGFDITLKVSGAGEVPLRVTAYTRGLPQGAGALPQDLTWSTWGANLTDVTAVGLTVRG
ncbi:M20/M25/M40 family metallo-hydrolase [Streptomyces sp. NPDC056491]|uniref:M20/M25/M40 family metallo-hydrolase n=1 Tax=Streptomyces sp. NPDC056491 TaxID=3345837 RepID=UPI00369F9C60